MKKNPVGTIMALALLAVFVTALRTEAVPTIHEIKETIEPITEVIDKILSPVWAFIQWLADLISSV